MSFNKETMIFQKQNFVVCIDANTPPSIKKNLDCTCSKCSKLDKSTALFSQILVPKSTVYVCSDNYLQDLINTTNKIMC